VRLGTLISAAVCLALVGSARPPDFVTEGRSRILLGAPVLSDRTVSEVSVRVTVPVSMWNSWSDENYPTDLAKTNLVSVRGTPALFLFCFEDYLPMLALSSIALAQPRDRVRGKPVVGP